MKIGNSILSVVFLILFLSLAGNFIQYKLFRKDPVVETIIEIDTVIDLDTIFIPESGSIAISDPEPVFVDLVKNIATHRDTFLHQYGWIATNETVSGELLSKGIEFGFNMPEYYKTRTVTKNVTRTLRNNLFFAQGGTMTDFSGNITPAIGGTYIWNNHRNILSLNVGLNRQISVSAGFVLWR